MITFGIPYYQHGNYYTKKFLKTLISQFITKSKQNNKLNGPFKVINSFNKDFL